MNVSQEWLEAVEQALEAAGVVANDLQVEEIAQALQTLQILEDTYGG